MQVGKSLVASLFGLLLVSAIPSYSQTVGAPDQTKAVEAWKRKISAQLLSKREFPPEAIGQSGTAKVKAVVDRRGKLISRELVESSGSDLLDAAALRIMERAEPYPEAPAKVKDDKLSFMLAFVFANRPSDWVEEQRKIDAKIRGICRGC